MVYQGSKRKYARYIVPILQEKIDEVQAPVFYDVMCGGCHIIQNIKAPKRIASDLNKDLIDLYKYSLRDDAVFPEKITREEWDAAKNKTMEESWKRALVCFFASYSARGFSGGYCLNSDRDYYNERLRDFKKQIPFLSEIEFLSKDYLNQDFVDGSVIYIDPPYLNTKRYDINKKFDYNAFWNKVRKDSEKNYVFVSEQVAPDDFKIIWEKTTTRNCFGSKTTKATEKLFTLEKN